VLDPQVEHLMLQAVSQESTESDQELVFLNYSSDHYRKAYNSNGPGSPSSLGCLYHRLS
jgi:hypothetical protein